MRKQFRNNKFWEALFFCRLNLSTFAAKLRTAKDKINECCLQTSTVLLIKLPKPNNSAKHFM
jgi:hypothetical protein